MAGKLTAISHDREAFRAFYRTHVEAVQRFIARRVDDPYLAADLTADVFLAAISSAATYRGSGAGELAWLYGVARNVVATDRRRRYLERSAVGRIAGRRLLEPDDLVRLEERIDAEARSRELYAAMDALVEGERAVLELVALDGLSVAEAARALGIRPVAARVRLHRARKQLRDQLTPFVAANPSLTEA
ncbi:RNA polymerase sigma factor [Tenggerimyces flavus]|uniref:RNA polymerase sigma factor n=1 Tax=Tenggerimyces flavus TaxID=1708749 RepID=A0ABV7YFF7_9ACTN|nr:RNA polymerase sigma factor [Tenggerimyces flavus]MBM7785951.1 RNA polymerase sigma-70 factor (ECF subfamily) [Tenggerimyces flavus]